MLMACLALCLAVAPSRAAPPEAPTPEWILARLAQPPPMRTQFVELRASRVLKAPLRVAGEYRRPSHATLVREVRSPYAETVTLELADPARATARIERGGKARTVPLSRAPELAALQAGLGALLSGDVATLRRHYTLAATGTRQAWVLTLEPREAAVARRLSAMTLHGRGAELRCIETRAAGAPVQRTLLAGAARIAAPTLDAAGLAALCRVSA